MTFTPAKEKKAKPYDFRGTSSFGQSDGPHWCPMWCHLLKKYVVRYIVTIAIGIFTVVCKTAVMVQGDYKCRMECK